MATTAWPSDANQQTTPHMAGGSYAEYHWAPPVRA